MPRRRYCEMCDEWFPMPKTECPECGMPTRAALKELVGEVESQYLENWPSDQELRFTELGEAIRKLRDAMPPATPSSRKSRKSSSKRIST